MIWQGLLMLMVLPVVALYLISKKQKQADLAKQHPAVHSPQVIAEFHKRADSGARWRTIAFWAGPVCFLMLVFGPKVSDFLPIAGAIGFFISVGMMILLKQQLRCPVCTSLVEASDRFCTKCGAQLQP